MIVNNTALDTTLCYETPEGIELELHLAGPVVRGLAWIIDFAIRATGYILVTIVVSLSGGIGAAISLILLFLVEWFYPVYFEIRSGATPGKKAMGILVIQEDGTPLTWSSSLLRNLLRAADFLPFLYCTGLISMLLNSRFQRLGDLAAGTVVVYPEQENRIPKIPEYPAKPFPVPLTLTEQRLVLDFAERGPELTADRRHELARPLSFLFKNRLSGKKNRVRLNRQQYAEMDRERTELSLLGYANWLVRGR